MENQQVHPKIRKKNYLAFYRNEMHVQDLMITTDGWVFHSAVILYHFQRLHIIIEPLNAVYFKSHFNVYGHDMLSPISMPFNCSFYFWFFFNFNKNSFLNNKIQILFEYLIVSSNCGCNCFDFLWNDLNVHNMAILLFAYSTITIIIQRHIYN